MWNFPEYCDNNTQLTGNSEEETVHPLRPKWRRLLSKELQASGFVLVIG